MRKVYLDHAAGKPVEERVLAAMLPFFTQHYGNPSSAHTPGNEARAAIDAARDSVATLVGAAKKEEIIFTSGATESNNLALKGTVLRNKDKGNRIITSSIEHMSIMNIFKELGKQDFEVVYLPVDEYGTVDVRALEKELNDRTILVSVMYANGEIGTIQPIRELSEMAHNKDAILHVDAVAATGQVPVNVKNDNIDLLTLSSNDLYGPKGVGALYIKSGTRIMPMIQGGGQERGLRSGTENLPGIVGMGKAAEIARAEMEVESARLRKIRDKLIKETLEKIPESHLNGHPINRLPNNANIRFSYIEGEALILSLDMEGIACSSGSACTSKTLEPSHALLATGLKHEEAHGSLLFTLGKQNTAEDVDYLLSFLPGIVKRLRVMSPLTPKELLKDV